MSSCSVRSRYLQRIFVCSSLLAICLIPVLPTAAEQRSPEIELTRAVRTWEFLPVVGARAGLFGYETGDFEAWVYPLKIFRDFHLIFHIGDRALPAESLARTLTVRPESATLLYAGDNFRVRETLSIPANEPGAVILLEIETEQPLEVEALFTPDFQLEWPAALGASYSNWTAEERAFYFGEEQRKFAALVGSPTAAQPQQEYMARGADGTYTSSLDARVEHAQPAASGLMRVWIKSGARPGPPSGRLGSGSTSSLSAVIPFRLVSRSIS